MKQNYKKNKHCLQQVNIHEPQDYLRYLKLRN